MIYSFSQLIQNNTLDAECLKKYRTFLGEEKKVLYGYSLGELHGIHNSGD